MRPTFASLVRQRAPYMVGGTVVAVLLAVAIALIIPHPVLTFFIGMILGSLGCIAGLAYGYRYGNLPR